jgi:hypothetical protein
VALGAAEFGAAIGQHPRQSDAVLVVERLLRRDVLAPMVVNRIGRHAKLRGDRPPAAPIRPIGSYDQVIDPATLLMLANRTAPTNLLPLSLRSRHNRRP